MQWMNVGLCTYRSLTDIEHQQCNALAHLWGRPFNAQTKYKPESAPMTLAASQKPARMD